MIAKISLVVAGLAVVSLLGATPSIARDYPFCRKGEAGPGDCKYDTYEQCAAAVSGTAGYWLLPAELLAAARRTGKSGAGHAARAPILKPAERSLAALENARMWDMRAG